MKALDASGVVAEPRGSFPTTHWSIVLHAGAASPSQARIALEMLCRQYWYPLYVFARRTGRSHHDAEDCTQEFLARLLATHGVAQARPERGRFRSFLLISLRHFLTNEWKKQQAAKRGGGQVPLALDFTAAGERFGREPADPGLTPEEAFDRTWALELTESALAELRAEYEKGGRGALFDALTPLLWGNRTGEPLAVPAARLGLDVHTVTVALQRLRRRVGDRLRARVAETVAEHSDVDAELHHLVGALASAGR